MECLNAIHGRRSIRQFTAEAVSEADIETMLRASMAAPSAGNQQSWRWIVVRDRAQLDRLAEATPYATPISRAPLAMVLCGDTRDNKHPGYWVQDCSAAMQNLLLAAHAVGLGAVWIGCHPVEERSENVRAICGIPEGIIPMSLVAIGHPLEEKPPVDRFDAEFVHRDRW